MLLMILRIILIFVVSGLLFMPCLQAGVITVLPQFTKGDRVLILAPHPDDEAIGAGGVIQMALEAGAQVKVVLLTNGENNQLSFIVYKKRPVLLPNEIIKMGTMRYQESVAAMMSLGLNQSDVIALGYPDYGTMEVFQKYWGSVKSSFRAMLSRRRSVPYQNARSFGAPYVGESILKDLEGILVDFKPTKVFVSHSVDVNRDHRAAYAFLKVALWDVEDRVGKPDVFPYLIHAYNWPQPRGYFPGKVLDVPNDLSKSDIIWNMLTLDPGKIQKKNEAIKFYVSQNKGSPKYLFSFARLNELFGDYPPVPIFKQMSSSPVWQQLKTSEDEKPSRKAKEVDQIAGLSYARVGNNLRIQMNLKRVIDIKMGVSIFLFGYKKGTPFGQMPKINLVVGVDGFHVKEKRKNILSKEIEYKLTDKEMVFSVPLSVLGFPDRILSSAQTALYDLAFDQTAWRELVIK
ncbi:MAG: PIG-L family deacetylase [Candidatus Omnitrophica bacterium]|nr:PIG-L family deacetylase [Candidatus Omnitrophota bacterium]